RWEHMMQEKQVRLEDSMELLDIAILLSEEVNAGDEQDSKEFISLAIVWSLIQSWVIDRIYQPNRKEKAKPATLYLANVSDHLPSTTAHPPQSPRLEIESAQQQLINMVQSEGDTTP
ncbi:DUF2857 domain-containing protein, partial [Pseudomonas aeruginosa]